MSQGNLRDVSAYILDSTHKGCQALKIEIVSNSIASLSGSIDSFAKPGMMTVKRGGASVLSSLAARPRKPRTVSNRVHTKVRVTRP